MSRVFWLNAALLAAVAALGAYVYLKPPREAVTEYTLSTLRPREIRAISFERSGAAALLLEKRQDGWHITSPFPARADALRVQQMLAIAEAKSSHRLPATQLARFELDRPLARLTLAGQAFSFGMVNPITREQYVLSGELVYTLHPRYGAVLPDKPADAASRQLFAADEAPVRIELREFTVEQRDGKWMLAPSAVEISQDELVRWVDEWRLAAALRVETQSRGKPAPDVRVRLKGGGRFTLGVIARQPELVLARSDEKVQYHLRAEAAKRLLTRPGTAPSEPAGRK